MTAARLKHYGWGREGEGMSAQERAFVFGRYHEKFGRKDFAALARSARSRTSCCRAAPRAARRARGVLHRRAL